MKTRNATGLPEIVSEKQWQAAHEKLLAKEKKATRARDALAADDAGCRWCRSTSTMSSRGPMARRVCSICSMGAASSSSTTSCSRPAWMAGPTPAAPAARSFVDHIGHLAHLHARDTSLALVSRAPLANIERYKKRMGWTVPWLLLGGSDFNVDFGLTTDQGETFGLSVFLRDGDRIFRTYFTAGRGVEALGSTWTFLDLTPLAAGEPGRIYPKGWPQTPPYEWWRRHDDYGPGRRE